MKTLLLKDQRLTIKLIPDHILLSGYS
jgi:hypothetical protein